MRKLILFLLSTIALLIYPLSLSAQNSFSLSLDMDSAASDQAVTSLNTSPDQVIAIQVFGKDIQNANNLTVSFEYDATQVVYEGFDVGDVLPNAHALHEQSTNPTFVKIGIVSFGGQATVNSGLFGTARFRTIAEFSGTAIQLLEAKLGRGGQSEILTLPANADPIVVTIGLIKIQPVLAVEETAVDFGPVEEAQTVQQTITIKNTGTGPLEVTGIESDVPGLTFEPSVFTLAPDSSATITIAFSNPVEGEFSGSISILSNDPNRAKHTVSVSVIVQAARMPVLVVGEPAIDFGSIDAEKTAQKTFTITNTGTAPLEITGIESDLPGLTFEPSMFTLAPDSSATVTIAFPKPMEGEFSGSISILSNDPDRAQHTLSISGIVQPLSVEAKSDFDGNGIINFADFLLFVSAFGSSEAQYDIDGNGSVDFPDFLMFVQVFGKTVDG